MSLIHAAACNGSLFILLLYNILWYDGLYNYMEVDVFLILLFIIENICILCTAAYSE